MRKNAKSPATKLSEYDRKILDKYTKFYTNMIESNTAKVELLKEERFEGRD